MNPALNAVRRFSRSPLRPNPDRQLAIGPLEFLAPLAANLCKRTAPGGFRQVSSALSPAVLRAISALGAGDPLTPEEERQRLGAGWDTPGH